MNAFSGDPSGFAALWLEGDCVVRDCVITNNKGPVGAGISCYRGNPLISNCVITKNIGQNYHNEVGQWIPSSGGAILCYDSNPTIVNCLISGNSAVFGGGIACGQSGKPYIVNCTIVSNVADLGGGVYSGYSSNPVITGSILRDNVAAYGGAQICVGTDLEESSRPSSATVSYSNVQGGLAAVDVDYYSTISWGSGNINSNPRFVNATDGDYHLLVASPCKDAGYNVAIDDFETDLDDNPRLIGNAVDMGAFEHQDVSPAEAAVPTGLDGTSWDISGSVKVSVKKVGSYKRSGIVRLEFYGDRFTLYDFDDIELSGDYSVNAKGVVILVTDRDELVGYIKMLADSLIEAELGNDVYVEYDEDDIYVTSEKTAAKVKTKKKGTSLSLKSSVKATGQVYIEYWDGSAEIVTSKFSLKFSGKAFEPGLVGNSLLSSPNEIRELE